MMSSLVSASFRAGGSGGHTSSNSLAEESWRPVGVAPLLGATVPMESGVAVKAGGEEV